MNIQLKIICNNNDEPFELKYNTTDNVLQWVGQYFINCDEPDIDEFIDLLKSQFNINTSCGLLLWCFTPQFIHSMMNNPQPFMKRETQINYLDQFWNTIPDCILTVQIIPH